MKDIKMNNIFNSDFLEDNEKEKSNYKMLLIISFFIGIIGLVIIMRLIEISIPKNSLNINKVV